MADRSDAERKGKIAADSGWCRRRMLAVSGASLTGALAGCTGTDGGTDDGTDDGTNDDGSDGGDSSDDETSDDEREDDENGDDGADTEGDGDGSETDGDGDSDGTVDLALEVRRRDQHNSVWERFEEVSVAFESVTLHARDGSTEEISVETEYDLLDGDFEDGNRVAEGVQLPPGTYERAELRMPVQRSSVDDGAADLPLEGFDPATTDLELVGDYFDPEDGDAWALQFFLVLRENYQGDAYVLDPAVGWIRE